MNVNGWIRQIHRWVSLLFTLVVAGIFAALGFGLEPAEWIYFLPLAPLAVLVPTGVYMFVLPYFSGRRGGEAST
ncbi:hypothetical protein [Pseudoruegeria sp. HB172150]|uniref:hypothetical protein n=1 Tax=Pseudoruegeria sp. HB172150 TaxID=2721164 RepID=UPI0015556CD2|nr:hypothetical protein [Pseudoruegeria sp. HB172150]